MALLGAWYLVATLPHLSDYPMLDVGQMGIVVPAAKLATQGTYGHDLFTGYYRSELRNYAYMPLYPLSVALSFRLFGLGVWQARIVSVAAGLLTVALTALLGWRVFSPEVGVLAGVVLCVVPLGGGSASSAIPLLDFARLIRFDLLVPVFVLASSWAFLRGLESSATDGSLAARSWRFAVAGLLAALATLTHAYGAFLLPVLLAVMVWRWGWVTATRPEPYAVLTGWLAGLMPWVLYVAQDVPAYVGQMAERHAGRFDIWSARFYGTNLLHEYRRYAPWYGGFPEGLLRFRPGFWLVLAGVVGGTVVLWRRAQAGGRMADRFLAVALPFIALQMALLINQKRYVYLSIELPFIALLVAVWVVALRQSVPERGRRVAGAVVNVLVVGGVLQGAWGVVAEHRTMSATTPYADVTGAIAAVLRPGSRLLLSETFWLGLAQHQARSVDLVYLESRRTPIDSVLARLDPDDVIFERFYVDPQSDPRGRGTPASEAWWRRFGDDVRLRCPQVRAVDGGSYGVVDVYHCRR